MYKITYNFLLNYFALMCKSLILFSVLKKTGTLFLIHPVISSDPPFCSLWNCVLF